MPSSTPLHLSWWITRKFSMSPVFLVKFMFWIILVWYSNAHKTSLKCITWCRHYEHILVVTVPGVFDSLGIRQRTKWGWVLLKLVISLPKFSFRHKTKYKLHRTCFGKNKLELYMHIISKVKNVFTFISVFTLTLNCEDTVCMEPPFFLPPFFAPPTSVFNYWLLVHFIHIYIPPYIRNTLNGLK